MRRLAIDLTALLFYGALVVWLTWPLGAHLATHRPDVAVESGFDGLLVTWALAHESRALASDPARFGEANIYFPTRHALFYAEAGFGALPYFIAPFLLTDNPVLAINFTLLLCVALTAWAVHLVVRWWTASHAAAFVAACALLSSHWLLYGFLGAVPNYAVLQYFPFIVYFSATPARRFSEALRLLPLIVLQSLSSIYLAPTVFLPLVAIAGWRLLRSSTRAAGTRLLAVVALSAVAVLLAYSGYLLVRLENPALQTQSPWVNPATVQTLDYGLRLTFLRTLVVPAVWLLIAAGLASRTHKRYPSGVPRGSWFYVTLWTVVGLYASQRPVVGEYGTPLAWPLVWLERWTPFYTVIRTPERLGIDALIGLVLLAGLAFAELSARIRFRPAVGAFAAAVAAAMYFALPPVPASFAAPPLNRPYRIKLAITPDSPILEALRAPGGPLVELPAGNAWREAEAMYRSVFHRRPILNGYSSYWPAGFQERIALADRLPDADALAALRRETRLGAVLVHLERLSPEKRDRWLAIAQQGESGGLRFRLGEGPQLLFTVDEPS